MKRIVAILIAILVTATLAYAAVKCPIDKSGAYFTGETKTDVSGKLLWKYKCNLYGHGFWVVK